LFREPITTITAFAVKYAVAYQTAKKDLELLVDAGILTELPNHYPKAFSCRELIHIAYDASGGEPGI